MHSDEAKASRYTDTFGRHEADLSSDGRPWRLVRDVGVGSFDEPQEMRVIAGTDVMLRR